LGAQQLIRITGQQIMDRIRQPNLSEMKKEEYLSFATLEPKTP